MRHWLALLLLCAPAYAQTTTDVRSVLVADLPPACDVARIYNVRDGASGTDCSTGGGSTAVWCVCDAGGATYTGVDPTAAGGGTDDQTAVEVPYTPTTGTDWVDPDPTEVLGGLDDLAGRLTVEEAKADNDTQLTQEQVEDFAGGMFTGNTETGITVTYQDGDGTIDLVVDDTTKLPLAGGTLTGEVTVDDLGLEFTAGDTLTDCSTFSATGGGIFFDDSEGIFKKCQDNVLTDLDTTGIGGSTGATDNALLRADGAGGSTAQAGASATLGDNGDVVAQQIALPSGPFQSTQPTVMFGDGDSGFWETADDQVKVMLSGAAEWHWIGPEFRGHDSNTPSLIAWAASATNPTVAPNRSDLDTGIGWASADSLALVSGGQTAIQMTESASVVTVTIDDVLELDPQSTPPVTCAAGTEGSLYSDSDSNELCFCDGTSWTGIKAGGSCS